MVKKSVVVEGDCTKFTWTFNLQDMQQKYVKCCGGIDGRVTARMKLEEMREWSAKGFNAYACQQLSMNKETPSNRLKTIVNLDQSILNLDATTGHIEETLAFGKQEISWTFGMVAIKFPEFELEQILCKGVVGIFGGSVVVKHDRGHVESVMLTYHRCERHIADNQLIIKPESDQTGFATVQHTAATVTAFDRCGCLSTPACCPFTQPTLDLFTLTIKLFNGKSSMKSERNLNVELWENRDNNFDVKFTFEDGSSTNAHKLILSAVSDVFKKTLETKFKEKSGKVKILDDKKTFEKLLEFMYLGTSEVNFDEDTDIADLLELANRYHLPDLKMKCARELIRKGECDILGNFQFFTLKELDKELNGY